MKKIDKILDMFDELLKTEISSEEAVFIVANSFYTSKDERINRDTLFRYIKAQVDIEKFHKALGKRDLSILNPQRYSAERTVYNISEKNDEQREKSVKKEPVKNEEFSPAALINEINSLKEKLDLFTKNYSDEEKILDIPKEMFSISEDNVKRATFRVEENTLENLEEFCKKHKEYNKTMIINFMIKDFLEKYNK